jgi:hypothetical protein
MLRTSLRLPVLIRARPSIGSPRIRAFIVPSTPTTGSESRKIAAWSLRAASASNLAIEAGEIRSWRDRPEPLSMTSSGERSPRRSSQPESPSVAAV